MRDDRRTTRNRVYMLVAAGMMVVICVVAMASFLHVGRKRMSEKYYPYPWKVLNDLVRLQNQFRAHDYDGDGVADFASSLAELEDADLITRAMAEEAVQGYRYAIVSSSPAGWAATATPATVTSLHYFVDHTNVVRAARGGPADGSSEVYWHPLYDRVWQGED